VTLVSPTGQSVPVVYGSATTTDGASPVATFCTPASGSSFSIGTTPVTCTATDARQRTDACTFPVVVQRPATIGATTFLAFGDSITFGEDGNSFTLTSLPGDPFGLAFPHVVLIGQQYPTVLQQLLAARYTLQTILVTNAGLRGELAGTSSAVSRFVNLVSTRQFEAALIMEGTNDVFDGTPSKIGPAISGLRSMIQAAKVRGVRPYVATVPPMDPNRPRGRLGYTTVPVLNDEIRALARTEGVTLVDVNQAFSGDLALLSADGLHPNANGFELIAKTFFDAIRSTLETSAPASQVWPPPTESWR
jgi:lysophospholipase L1-like esterase